MSVVTSASCPKPAYGLSAGLDGENGVISSKGAGRSADLSSTLPQGADGSRPAEIRERDLSQELEQAVLREGIDRFRNDEVIEYPHVDQRERLPEPARDEFIGRL